MVNLLYIHTFPLSNFRRHASNQHIFIWPSVILAWFRHAGPPPSHPLALFKNKPLLRVTLSLSAPSRYCITIQGGQKKKEEPFALHKLLISLHACWLVLLTPIVVRDLASDCSHIYTHTHTSLHLITAITPARKCSYKTNMGVFHLFIWINMQSFNIPVVRDKKTSSTLSQFLPLENTCRETQL